MRGTPGGMQRMVLEAHLDSAKQTWSAFPWVQAQTFEVWFGFLTRSDLAEGDALYRITTKGETFLSYIEALALPPRVF
jgi:hypothetical protein